MTHYLIANRQPGDYGFSEAACNRPSGALR